MTLLLEFATNGVAPSDGAGQLFVATAAPKVQPLPRAFPRLRFGARSAHRWRPSLDRRPARWLAFGWLMRPRRSGADRIAAPTLRTLTPPARAAV